MIANVAVFDAIESRRGDRDYARSRITLSIVPDAGEMEHRKSRRIANASIARTLTRREGRRCVASLFRPRCQSIKIVSSVAIAALERVASLRVYFRERVSSV